MTKDIFQVDFREEGKTLDASEFQPMTKHDIEDYIIETGASVKGVAGMAIVASNRGDSEEALLPSLKALSVIAAADVLANRMRSKFRKGETAKGKVVDIRPYIGDRPSTTNVSESDPDAEGTFDKSYESADEFEVQKSFIPSESPAAIARMESYVRKYAMGNIRSRLNTMSHHGHSKRAISICDWLIDELKKIRGDL